MDTILNIIVRFSYHDFFWFFFTSLFVYPHPPPQLKNCNFNSSESNLKGLRRNEGRVAVLIIACVEMIQWLCDNLIIVWK